MSATVSLVSFPLHSFPRNGDKQLQFMLQGSFTLNVLCKPECGCSQDQGSGLRGRGISSLPGMAVDVGRLYRSLV